MHSPWRSWHHAIDLAQLDWTSPGSNCLPRRARRAARNRPRPEHPKFADAIVRVTHSAICGSDLWFYRGITEMTPGERTGHEFVGVVEEVGSDVRDFRRGDSVIAPFVMSDGTCEFCHDGLQTSWHAPALLRSRRERRPSRVRPRHLCRRNARQDAGRNCQ